jgi:hypothetical protein
MEMSQVNGVTKKYFSVWASSNLWVRWLIKEDQIFNTASDGFHWGPQMCVAFLLWASSPSSLINSYCSEVCKKLLDWSE